MKVEILFPEVCNLYGDLQNIYYLKRCCPAPCGPMPRTSPQGRTRDS